MKVLIADIIIKRLDDQDIDEAEAQQFSEALMQFLEEEGYEMGGVIALVEEDDLEAEDDDYGDLQ